MSLDDFQLLDIEPFDNSIIKRDYLKLYHQQGANLNDSDQIVEIVFGEKNNYHQIGNAHLEFDITTRKAGGSNFNVTNDAATNDLIRLINNGFAYCFKGGRLSTTGGSDLEHNKIIGRISTIMRCLTSENGDLLSHFDNIDETENGINNSSLKQMLINNHTKANRSKIKGVLPLEHIFDFCKTFEKKY